jgi:hypothetical protein
MNAKVNLISYNVGSLKFKPADKDEMGLFTPLESPVPLQNSFVTGPVFQHGVKYPEPTGGLKPHVGFLMEFTEELKKRNIFFTLRKSRGQDIRAACGQLRAHFATSPFMHKF